MSGYYPNKWDHPEEAGDEWNPAPPELSLSPDEVHVWRLRTDLPRQEREALARHLSEDEADRASRFRLDQHRHDFVVCRGMLRVVLSRYLACRPERLRFHYGAWGKPALAVPSSPRLEFNVSHSGGCALFAVGLDRRVGVDLEQIRPSPLFETVLERFFTPEESSHILSMPEAQRSAAFYFIWTRKEAFVKATGAGLSLTLDSFDVSRPSGYPCPVLNPVQNAPDGSHWLFRDLNAFPDFAASLAVEGDCPSLRFWQCAL